MNEWANEICKSDRWEWDRWGDEHWGVLLDKMVNAGMLPPPVEVTIIQAMRSVSPEDIFRVKPTINKWEEE